LTVKFPGSEYQTVFVAPSQEFSDIHGTDVYSIDTSGDIAVSSGSDGQLKLWGLKDGNIQHSFEGHVMDVNRARFFPSGSVVLSAGMDMSARVWCVETGQCVRTFKGHIRRVNDVAFVGEGDEVFTCSSDGTVRRWSCSTSECIKTITPVDSNTAVNAIVLKDLGESTILAIASDAGVVVGYDINKGKECFRFSVSSKHSCTSIHLDCTSLPNNRIEGGSTAMEIDYNVRQNHLDFVCFVGTSNGEIHCFDVEKSSLLAILKTNCGRVTKLDAIKGQLVASFADGSVKIISSLSGPHVTNELSGPDCSPVFDFSVKEPGMFASACRDKILRLYNLFL